MQYHSKFSFAAITTLLCLKSLSLHSQDYYDFDDYLIECDPLPYAACDFSFSAEIDYLLFYACQEGLSFATTANILANEVYSEDIPTKFDAEDLFFENKWNSGVRGIVGFKPSSHSWDIRAAYTFYETNVNGGTTSGFVEQDSLSFFRALNIVGESVLNDYQPNAVGSANSTEGNFNVFSSNMSTWRLYFNQFELNFGHEFDLLEECMFRPFLALRGIWIHQRLHESNLQGKTPLDPGSLPNYFVHTDFSAKNQYNAAGAAIGFDTLYQITSGLDLFGNFTGTLFWGRFTVNQSFTGTDIINPDAEELLYSETLSRPHQGSSLNFDISIGLRYSIWLNCNRNLLSLKFAWEQHLYTNINQFQNMIMNQALNLTINGESPRPDPTFNFNLDHNIERGALSLCGFTFGLAYSF